MPSCMERTNLVAETGAVNLSELHEHRGLPPLLLTQQAEENASHVFISLSLLFLSFHVLLYVCSCACGGHVYV